MRLFCLLCTTSKDYLVGLGFFVCVFVCWFGFLVACLVLLFGWFLLVWFGVFLFKRGEGEVENSCHIALIGG